MILSKKSRLIQKGNIQPSVEKVRNTNYWPHEMFSYKNKLIRNKKGKAGKDILHAKIPACVYFLHFYCFS